MVLRVDPKVSVSLVGTVLKYVSVPLAVPIAAAVVYGESLVPFVLTIAVAVVVGTGLERLHPDPELSHREGYPFVALTWLAVPLLGTLPTSSPDKGRSRRRSTPSSRA